MDDSMIYEMIWLLIIPGVIYHWYCIMKNNTGLVYSGVERWKPTRITFLIATKCCPPFVQDTVNSIHTACKNTGYSNYKVNVLTQKDKSCKVEGAEMIHVPSNYTCASKFKAKDLNYALSLMPNSKKEWIFHLDEDSKVIDQTINALHHYINNGGRPVANGLSVFIPSKSLCAFYGEAQRMWTFVFLKELLKNTPLWMNGSNMLVRSDIEQEIGWNFGNSFGEDTSFAYHISKTKGKIFGWHGGLTIEQPCKNITELFKQRKRWFASGLLYLFHCPKELQLLRIYSTFSWFAGFILTSIYFLNKIGLYEIMPIYTSIFAITIIFWYGRFQLGLYYMFKYNGEPIKISTRLLYHTGMIILTPVIEFLCTCPTLFAILNPPKGFEVTEK